MKESINVKRQKLTSSGQPWSCQPLYCKCHTVLTFLLGPENHNVQVKKRTRTMRERTVCQLQCCCCIRAWLWAEPERQPICEKFEKETNTRYNFMQKILEWWKDLICSMNLMKNLLVIVNSPSSNEEPSFWGQYGIDADAWIVTDQIDNGSKTLESIL